MAILQSYTYSLVTAFSALTIIGQIVIVILLGLLIVDFLTHKKSKLFTLIASKAGILMLIVALLATLGSLFFSEIAEWNPCKYCWLQRIFMYPQVILLMIALWYKDKHVARYILAMSIIGMVIAGVHYAEQVHAALYPVLDQEGVNMLLKPCDTSGVSCAKTEIHFTFGYITLPMMALTAFMLNIIGSLFIIRRQGKSS